MNVNDEEQYRERMAAYSRACSDPLFIGDYFQRSGHDERKLNGTATFIKYEGRHYACTAFHMTEEAQRVRARTANPNVTLELRTGRSVLPLSGHGPSGQQWRLRRATNPLTGCGIDICWADIDSIWPLLRDNKGKTPIDLDDWQEPPWNKVRLCQAAGYLNEHKTRENGMVAAPMAEITVEREAPLSVDTRSFSLFSTLEEKHGWYFSGTSGGPILACWDDQFTPIGIVFEGSPSSSRRSKDDFSYAGEKDLLVRGELLTPARFGEWLDNSHTIKW